MLTEETVRDALDSLQEGKAADGLDMKDWHRIFCMDAASKGRWSGCPLPIELAELVIEPRSPYANMNGMQICNGNLVQNKLEENNKYKIINSWFSYTTGMRVTIVELADGKRLTVKEHHTIDAGHRVDMMLNLIGASYEIWSIETELQAMKKLSTLVKPHIFNYYVITGTFIETSKRSGVTYLFRRSRPTIALSSRGDSMRILTTLCLHPIGYYNGTWAGTMVPTDDVIAHLMMMRGDEHYFWKKSSQHCSHQIESGI